MIALLIVATGFIAGVVAMLLYIGLGLSESPTEPWRAAWELGAIGLPFTMAVTLYDCSQRALTEPG